MEPNRKKLIKEMAFATAEFGSVQKYLAPRLDALLPEGDIDSDLLKREIDIISEEVEAAGGSLPASLGRGTVKVYRTIQAEAPWAWELYSYTVLEDSMGVDTDVRVATLEQYRETPKKLVKRTWRTIKGTRQDNSTNDRATAGQKAEDIKRLALSLFEKGDIEALKELIVKNKTLLHMFQTLIADIEADAAAASRAGGGGGGSHDPEWENLDRMDEAITKFLTAIQKRFEATLGQNDRPARQRVALHARQLAELLLVIADSYGGQSVEEFLAQH